MTALADALRAIGLTHTAAELDDLAALATKRRWNAIQLLEHIADAEQRERAKRSLDRRVDRARLGGFKPFADFDWAWPTRIDREAVDAALRLDFLADHRNIVLVAPQGLGKTMIAQNVVHAALQAGHNALFITAAQMLLDLGGQDSARALDRRLRFYASRPLLCIDEIGYLSYDARNADLLFQVVSRRYERKSLVLTTNLAFADWPTVFPNAACTTALIDRVVHHADIIAIEGESYRRREAQQAQTAKLSRRPRPST
jgi:DNA replication protein DnaC